MSEITEYTDTHWHKPSFANELRIGNWVHAYDHTHFVRVYGCNPSHKVWIEEKVGTRVTFSIVEDKLINGIPLSPEILEKAGFAYRNKEKKRGWMVNGLRRINLLLDSDGELSVWLVGIGVVTHKRETPIEYLHQLQNLFYALTGEELIIQDL